MRSESVSSHALASYPSGSIGHWLTPAARRQHLLPDPSSPGRSPRPGVSAFGVGAVLLLAMAIVMASPLLGLGGQAQAVAPVLQSATVDGTTLELTYDQALDASKEPEISTFTVEVDSVEVTVSAVNVAGMKVSLTLANAVTKGQTVTLSYDGKISEAGEAIQNTSGETAALFADDPVTNQSNAPPTASNVEVATDEDTTHIFAASEFNFSDMDSSDTLASVKITTLPSSGRGTLSVGGVAITTVPEGVTRAQLDANELVYTPPVNANGQDFATFMFRVNDGDDDSTSTYTMTIDVTAVNDAPTASNGEVATDEDTTHMFAASEFGFSDTADGGTLASVKITVLPLAGTGTLSVGGVAITTVPEGVTRAQLDAGELLYTPPAGASGDNFATFMFRVNDGDDDSTSAYTMTIDIRPANRPPPVRVVRVNDPPTASDGEVRMDEDTTRTFATSEFNFSDPDSGDRLVRVRITALPPADRGTLRLGGVAINTGDLPRAVTRAELDAKKLAYSPPPDANGDNFATFMFRVNDGEDDSRSAYTMTVHVNAVNDAPTSADGQVTTNEDTPHTFAASEFDFADTDIGGALASVKITMLPSTGTGTLSVGGTPIVDLPTAVTKAELDVSELVYTPPPDANGKDFATFMFRVNDGEDDSASAYTMTISVTAVNDAPTASDGEVSTDEDTTRAFAASEFGFSDTESGDRLGSVKITALPSADRGTLGVDGAVIETGDLPRAVTKAELDANKLVYTPPPDANGEDFATFMFRVNDGEADSTSAYTMTISVNAVNDAPTASDGEVTTDEDTTHTFTVSEFNFSDTESGDRLGSVKITALPSADRGTLSVDGAAIESGDLPRAVTRAGLDARKLVYTPPPDANGNDYATFMFRVNDGEDDSTSDYAMTISVNAVDDPPPVPSAPRVDPVAGDGRLLDVRWNTVIAEGEPPVSDYDVQYRDAGSPRWIAHPHAGTATVTQISGLVPETLYEVRVLARNDAGAGPWSPPGMGRTTGVWHERGVQAWLPRFGRTVADQVLDAVDSRMSEVPASGVESRIAGQPIGSEAMRGPEAGTKPGDERPSLSLTGAVTDEIGSTRWHGDTQIVTGRELLTGSSFALTTSTEGEGLVSVWGRGAAAQFGGSSGDVSVDGEVLSGLMGADWTRGRWTAGLLMSHSVGDGGYRGRFSGEIVSTLTGLHSWLRHSPVDRLALWGVLGFGEGGLTLEPGDAPAIRTDLDLWLAASGLEGTVHDGGSDSLSLTGKTDVMIVRATTDARSGSGAGDLVAVASEVTRLRLGLEGALPMQLADGSALTLDVESGVRLDEGDAETGLGADIGVSLTWTHPGRGFSAELRGRGLLDHEAKGFRDRALSGSFSWEPVAGGRGPQLSLTQTVRAEALRRRGALEIPAAIYNRSEFRTRRLEARFGYGFAAFGDRFTWTPEAGIGFSDTERDYRLGWRLVRGGEEGGSAGGSFELSGEGPATRGRQGSVGAGPGRALGQGPAIGKVLARASRPAGCGALRQGCIAAHITGTRVLLLEASQLRASTPGTGESLPSMTWILQSPDPELYRQDRVFGIVGREVRQCSEESENGKREPVRIYF